MDTYRITDDTKTINLTTAAGYPLQLNTIAPGVSRINKGLLGPFYEDVEERLLLNVTGSSVSQTLQRNHELRDLLLQAERWYRGEPVDAVKVEYKPTGSALTNPVSAVIVPEIDYRQPPGFDTVSKTNFVLRGVRPSFVRRGLWLGDTESKAVAKSSGNPAQMTTAAFADDFAYPVPHDLKLELDNAGGTGQYDLPDIYLLVQSAADKLWWSEAETNTVKTNFTTTAVTNASGGNVAEYSGSAGAEGSLYVQAINFQIDTNARAMEFFAVVKNQSTTGGSSITWDLRAALRNNSTWYYGRKTTVPVESTSPIRIVKLGQVTVPDEIDGFFLEVTPSATVPGGEELQIDYIAAVVIDDETSIINAWEDEAQNTNELDYWEHNMEIHVLHRLDSHLDGVLRIHPNVSSSPSLWPNIDGRPEIYCSGTVVSVIMFGITENNWIVETSGHDDADITLTVTRTKGYLIPR